MKFYTLATHILSRKSGKFSLH